VKGEHTGKKKINSQPRGYFAEGTEVEGELFTVGKKEPGTRREI